MQRIYHLFQFGKRQVDTSWTIRARSLIQSKPLQKGALKPLMWFSTKSCSGVLLTSGQMLPYMGVICLMESLTKSSAGRDANDQFPVEKPGVKCLKIKDLRNLLDRKGMRTKTPDSSLPLSSLATMTWLPPSWEAPLWPGRRGWEWFYNTDQDRKERKGTVEVCIYGN